MGAGAAGVIHAGDSFPAFELHDLDGHTWRREDLLGRSSVAFCFASW
jgi:peroxiredoxin